MAATTLAAPAHVTLDAFYQMADLPNGAELVDGEVVVTPAPVSGHGYLVRALFRTMDAHALAGGGGEVFGDNFGYDLPLPDRPDTHRIPDVSFVRAERVPRPRPLTRAFPLAPDLAVEVLSPSDTYRVVRSKLDDYLQAGARAVWVVDPEARTVDVYVPGAPAHVLRESDTLDGGDAFPGFTLPLAQLFAVLDD